MAVYDEARLGAISHEIGEAIDQASFGVAPWARVCQLFADAFPGSSAGVINQDFVHGRMNLSEMVNVEPDMQASYVAHFAYINPWSDVWTRMPSGSVFVAERHLPSRTFRNSEFYNDWLLPSGGITCGLGLKVDASPSETICLPLHYSERFAEAYDNPAAEVSRRLAGNVARSISATIALRTSAERLSARAALLERSVGPAMVLDGAMRLVDANQAAIDLIAEGSFARSIRGTVSFVEPRLDRDISRSVRDLVLSPNAPAASIFQEDGKRRWLFSFARLPTELGAWSLLRHRPHVLLSMKCLTPLSGDAGLDLRGLASHFRLTPAETKLCVLLAEGRTLADAAAGLGISSGTARQRIKVIFQKTGTGRQAELCLLLARYGF